MVTLTEVLANRPDANCNFKSWYESLGDEDKASVRDVMNDETRSTSSLFGTFREFGLSVSRDTFTRHRRGSCGICKPLGIA